MHVLLVDQNRCKYNGGKCPNQCAIRAGAVRRFCEYHRDRANAHQKKYQRKKRQARAVPTLRTESAVPSPQPPSRAQSNATPSSLVVYLVTSGKNVGDLSGVHVGERFQAVSADGLRAVLDTFDRDTTFLIHPQTIEMSDVSASVPDDAEILTQTAPELFEFPSDTVTQYMSEDFNWLSDLFVQ